MHSVTHKNPIISRANSVINEELYDKSSFPTRNNDEGGNEEVVRPSEDDFAQFKQQVAEWIKIDDQIRKLSIAIRERKTHQRALGKKVQEFMVKNKYDNLDTKHGVIKSNVKEVAQPIKLAEVRTKIEELDDDTPLTKKELMEKLFEAERPVITKQSLLRKIPKVSMHLDL
jgi:seryl-tRNA synthetase